jgi:hypothetical protein
VRVRAASDIIIDGITVCSSCGIKHIKWSTLKVIEFVKKYLIYIIIGFVTSIGMNIFFDIRRGLSIKPDTTEWRLDDVDSSIVCTKIVTQYYKEKQ